MPCLICKHYKYETPTNLSGCSIWSDYRLNLNKLPNDDKCQGCSDNPPTTPGEFITNIRRYGPKSYGVGHVKIGNHLIFGGIIVESNQSCSFYKRM